MRHQLQPAPMEDGQTLADVVLLEIMRLHSIVSEAAYPNNYGPDGPSEEVIARSKWAREQLSKFHDALIESIKAEKAPFK